jgi:hypothetical protein
MNVELNSPRGIAYYVVRQVKRAGASSLLLQFTDLGGEDEIAFGQTADAVG